MNIKDLKEMLSDFPAEFTPMIWGTHGTGKTEVVRQLAKEVWGLRCEELQGSQLSDQGDLVGLQRIMRIKDSEGIEHEETVWIPPYWYPKDGKPVCLFLDEINRAQPDIKRAMMQLGNDQKVLNMKLPEGSRIICASNPGSGDGDYDVEEWDDAENDRFWHVDFTPTVSEWMDHEREIGGLGVVIDYIAANEADLDPYSMKASDRNKGTNGTAENVRPSRRSWTRFDRVLKEKIEKRGKDYFTGTHGKAMLIMLAQGYFGADIARKFAAYYAQHGTGLTPREVLTQPWNKSKKAIEEMLNNIIIETVNFGRGLADELDTMYQNGDFVVDKKATDAGKLAADNWYQFLTTIPKEAAAQINGLAIHPKGAKAKDWVGVISRINPKVRDFYIDLVSIDI